ncbi:hypothetical protein SYNPS1DRAFT_31898 [Syncephalis pseudoplumigaleata]|uniref:Uncharacterized protein n=1 Tax=Syncephalis pseudoplumigaleata TaxID=1712513 RepID=A0A4V1J0R7_9FUNG|nr:hypothetical protein SYNPS1DRAFT_31898 [Syncephalis pseudoplumigaleata]|eukprot:RKP22499.1 hypothetical protein SYNPS1DRAFT_31898 [Syncephalis pseudoplumigaleata]
MELASKHRTTFVSLNEPEEVDALADVAAQARAALDPLVELYQQALAHQQQQQPARAVACYEQAMDSLLMRQLGLHTEQSDADSDASTSTSGSEETEDDDEDDGDDDEDDDDGDGNSDSSMNKDGQDTGDAANAPPLAVSDTAQTSNTGAPMEHDIVMQEAAPDAGEESDGESPAARPSTSRRSSMASQRSVASGRQKQKKMSAATEQAIMAFIENTKELRRMRDQLQFLVLTNFARLLAMPSVAWTDLPRALTYTSKAVTLDAANTAVWCQLARMARQCSKPSLMLHAYEQGLLTRMLPASYDAHRAHSWPSMLESLADTWPERVATLSPYGWECLLGLCQALFERGDIHRCQQLMAPILDVYPDVQIDAQLRGYIDRARAIRREAEKQLCQLDATWMVGRSSASMESQPETTGNAVLRVFVMTTNDSIQSVL